MLANLSLSIVFFPPGSEDPSRLWNCHNKGPVQLGSPICAWDTPEHCLSFSRVSSCVGFVFNHPVSDPYFDPLAHVPLHPDELFDVLFFWLDLTGLLINFLPPDSPMYVPLGTLPGAPSHPCRLLFRAARIGDELIPSFLPHLAAWEDCRK